MSSLATIEANLNRLPSEQRVSLLACFREIVSSGLRFGRAIDQRPSENFAAGFYEAVTDSVPDTEFSIAHGFGTAPYLLIPILPLVAGTQMVPLTVTRAPDAKRVYLSSSVADAPITVFLEG